MSIFEDYEYDPSDYYEPSDADNVLTKAFEGIEEILNKKVMQKYGYLEKKSEKLNNERKELNKKEAELINRERIIQSKERNLENEFNKRKLSDVYEELMKSFGEEFFKIKTTFNKKEKCDLCDKNREVKIKAQCGKEHKVYCSCNDSLRNYIVVSDYAIKLSFWKTHGKSYRRLSLCTNRDGDGYFSDIDTDKIITEFDKNLDNMQWCNYNSEELAQKYCDFLNKKE